MIQSTSTLEEVKKIEQTIVSGKLEKELMQNEIIEEDVYES
jgi:hypothetical protein